MRFMITAATMCLFLAATMQVRAEKLGLEQVIREVCANSDSVKMMKETLTKSQQMVREKYAAAFPTVSASVAALRMYGVGVGLQSGGTSFGAPSLPDTMTIKGRLLNQFFSGLSSLTAPSETPFYKAGLSVSQPLFTFGKIGTAVQVAKQFDKSVRSSNDRSLQQLQLLGLDAFYRVVLAQISLDVAKRSMNRKQALYELLDRNFSLGSGGKAQLLSAKADMKSQVPAINRAEQDLLVAAMTLNMLMGRPLSDSITLDTALAIHTLTTFVPPSKEDAIRQAVDKREDLRALGFLAQANRGGAQIFKAMYLPSIAATGSFGTQGAEAKDLGNWDDRNWTIGLGMQWEFFDGFANSARAGQYASDGRKLDMARQAILKSIEIEITRALRECVAADSNQVATDEALAAAQESYELTNDNFKQGSGQLTDLQLADEKLLQAEKDRINARYSQVRSRAALLVAMGSNIVDVK